MSVKTIKKRDNLGNKSEWYAEKWIGKMPKAPRSALVKDINARREEVLAFWRLQSNYNDMETTNQSQRFRCFLFRMEYKIDY